MITGLDRIIYDAVGRNSSGLSLMPARVSMRFKKLTEIARMGGYMVVIDGVK